MKSILLICFIFSFSAYAGVCQNELPESEVIRACNLEPFSGAGTTSCKEKPNEICYCFDDLLSWEVCEMVPSLKKVINNPTKLKNYQLAIEAKIAAREAEQVTKKALIEELKLAKRTDLTSNAKTSDLVMKMLELLLKE